jgi:DUF971 family protein
LISEPVGIEADRALGTVSIGWADGHQSVYTAPQLRWACPCAVCQGEWGRPGVLAGLDALEPDELQFTDVLAVGPYAITPVWASGHSSGIYSFEYLRGICSCEQCRSSPENPR